MRKILIFLVLICLLPTRSFASVEFFALLPNPTGDDTLGEYIEIRNTGCQTMDIGGYRLTDASQKSYTIPTSTIIESHSNRTFLYSETKIALNNSGDESITLMDASGIILDTESYSATQKDNIVISLSPVDESCVEIPPVETNTGVTDSGSGASDTSGGQGSGTTSTGTSSTGSQDNSSTGGTTDTGSGTENQTTINPSFSGELDTTNTGTTVIGSGASETSGGQNTEPTNTGTTNTDAASSSYELTSSGVLFPEIVPIRQEPTNATLSGNIWDCGTNQPCRVNVTFDPIFTGSFLSKNYLCEVVTATGILATCNPNTLYFSIDSSFSFRLTSKVDPSQSMTVSWGVIFTVSQGNSSTGTINTGTAISDAGSGASETSEGQSTEATSTGVISSSSGIIFPEIIPTYQNYTNTTNSGDTLTCVTSPCRVNFTLDPIFTGAWLAKNYTCEIHYGTGAYDSCNPPQLYPIGTGSIEIIVTHKASGQKETKTLEILQDISTAPNPSKSSTNIASVDMARDTTNPIAIIDFDGKLKSYYEQVNDYEFNCYAMTCAVNLTAERSYDPDGGSIRYLWIYSQNEVKTTKDPGAQKYTIGDHAIIFRVIDSSGNYDEIRYIIHVLGPKTEEEKIKTKKVKDPSLTKTKESSKKKKKKIIEMYPREKKMDFFDPPTIALQKSKFTRIDDRYICRTTTRTCSLNLSLSGAEKGVVYTWEYDDGDIITSKNPRSKSFAPGVHEIIVSATYSGSTDILWTQILSVQVDKIAKPKKAKKPKKVKVQKSKQSSTPSLIPTAYASGVPTRDDPEGDLPSFLLFVSIISITAWYRQSNYLSKKREQEAKGLGL